MVWDNSLSLSFYFDSAKEKSQTKFRIYAEDDPIWNKYSGVDINVPLISRLSFLQPGILNMTM